MIFVPTPRQRRRSLALSDMNVIDALSADKQNDESAVKTALNLACQLFAEKSIATGLSVT